MDTISKGMFTEEPEFQTQEAGDGGDAGADSGGEDENQKDQLEKAM